ncbi:M61 family metallopeptidase [Uliginosibacterium aquaticum]|uniref:M61 family metallopeptidase n=1 Tax=Uliginosibacterium aquaticum TaxID=2731212 RepID=A0ABX2IFQ4_9RHOO|nr:PDZ domain-containing protein [Uliginosibacterium aquaticum]NSL55521.1 M61 family metallopeptidase [Uliginosibacterium aquaticum]
MSIEYRVEARNPQAHLFSVTLTLAAPQATGEILRLPAWIPGSYMIREFARNFVEIRASQGGKAVALEKLDKHSWRTAKLDPDLALVVESVVYAWDLSVRCAHLDQSHGFFNGTQLFLQVTGREKQPHRVDIRRPEGADFERWKVATTLPAATKRSVDRAGFGLREAPDYDTLIDHPVEMGAWQSVKFEAGGVPHEMVITGRAVFDAQRLASDLKKACEAVLAHFGKRPPFSQYLFMTLVVGEGYGGLEHRDSTALICSRNDLPVPGELNMSEGYRTFLGLCSHEYFHAWNVKRIKPAVFTPYRLQEENYTRLLWVFEGFTSYYDDLALLRAGLITPAEYLGLMAKNITAVERNGGRLKQSVADSSFDAWTKYYRQDENSPNAIVSYYQKGALVAFGLDLTIRAKTRGAKSLDDVMRHLWQHYGADSAGVPEGAMPAIIKAATGVDVRREVARWAEGTEDVPLAKLLKPFGISLSRKSGSRSGGLGLRTRSEGNVLKLANVLDGGTAQAAGLSAGDELVALNGLRVTGSNLDSLLARCSVGDVLEILVFRRDELLRFAVLLAAPRVDECLLTLASGATDNALLQGWLKRA